MASIEKKFPFSLHANAYPRYPMFWKCEPTVLSKINYMNLDLKGQVLVDVLSFSPHLKLAKLVELGDDLEKLTEYMCKSLCP